MTMTDPRALPVTAVRSALRYGPHGPIATQAQVAAEYALTIYVNDAEMATIVCTPEHLEDMVVGFLASEGVVRSAAQLQRLALIASQGVARAYVAGSHNFNQAFYNKRYIASCCGKSRQSFYFYNDAHTAKVATDAGTRFTPADVISFMAALEASSDIFSDTGGVHSAGLCAKDEGLVLARADIGRHNAIDKLYGHLLRSGDDAADKAIVFSGRLSSEVLLKAAKIGVGIIIAKSAPTAMALDMAETLRITAIGFARRDEFTVYTHPWRVQA